MEVSRSQLCDRARFWASLRIDGELSELEGALLDAHLARCPECSAVVAGFGGVTESIRGAKPVRPTPFLVRRGHARRRLAAPAAAAVIVVFGALAGGLVRHNLANDAKPSAPRAVAMIAAFETPDQLRSLRRRALLNARRLPRDLADPI
jgi:hypothetical protein